MSFDKYRKQTQLISDEQKQALTTRVMERSQVDLLQTTIDEDVIRIGGKLAQEVRIPDWFAE